VASSKAARVVARRREGWWPATDPGTRFRIRGLVKQQLDQFGVIFSAIVAVGLNGLVGKFVGYLMSIILPREWDHESLDRVRSAIVEVQNALA